MRLRFLPLLFLLSLPVVGQVKIAQLSDLHIGTSTTLAPNATANLRSAVQTLNARGVDAVIVTGDIGENATSRALAHSILQQSHAPVYYVPGNHDLHSKSFTSDLTGYKSVFGDDYFRKTVKNVVIYGLDSEGFGNYDSYSAAKTALPAVSAQAAADKTQMFAWMQSSANPPPPPGTVVIGFQHIPIALDGNILNGDTSPYWSLPVTDRTAEANLLKSLGIQHMFVGHWHHRDVFTNNGITWHVGTSTGRKIGDSLGFQIHTIAADGSVTSEFVPLN